MFCNALVPVQSLDYAKSRLVQGLDKRQREALVLKMLEHVLYVLKKSKQCKKVSVVTSDSRIIKQAGIWEIDPIIEKTKGHNQALHEVALQEKKEPLLTISSDLPLLTVEDIQSLIALLDTYKVILAPSKEGTGTNAILTRIPFLIPYLFGENSFEKFLKAAKDKNLTVAIYRSKTIAFDVDTIDDLRKLEKDYPGF